MADVMDERVRSIEFCAGLSFTLGALFLSLSLCLYPRLAPANQTNLILDALSKEDIGSWMGLHALMVVGFLLATLGLVAYGFLLHLKGSSGPASLVSTSALIGGGLWTTFLSMEFFVGPFLKTYYPIDPGLATMLFSTVWFWKMGALAVGGVLLFTAVIGAGVSGTSRGMMPLWLGWGGAFFGVVGILVYVFEFWAATATGTAINPLRGAGVRYGVGLPIQLWMIGAGLMLLRDYNARAHTLPPQMRTPVPPKREPAAMPRAPEPPPLPPPIP